MDEFSCTTPTSLRIVSVQNGLIDLKWTYPQEEHTPSYFLVVVEFFHAWGKLPFQLEPNAEFTNYRVERKIFQVDPLTLSLPVQLPSLNVKVSAKIAAVLVRHRSGIPGATSRSDWCYSADYRAKRSDGEAVESNFDFSIYPNHGGCDGGEEILLNFFRSNFELGKLKNVRQSVVNNILWCDFDGITTRCEVISDKCIKTITPVYSLRKSNPIGLRETIYPRITLDSGKSWLYGSYTFIPPPENVRLQLQQTTYVWGGDDSKNYVEEDGGQLKDADKCEPAVVCLGTSKAFRGKEAHEQLIAITRDGSIRFKNCSARGRKKSKSLQNNSDSLKKRITDASGEYSDQNAWHHVRVEGDGLTFAEYAENPLGEGEEPRKSTMTGMDVDNYVDVPTKKNCLIGTKHELSWFDDIFVKWKRSTKLTKGVKSDVSTGWHDIDFDWTKYNSYVKKVRRQSEAQSNGGFLGLANFGLGLGKKKKKILRRLSSALLTSDIAQDELVSFEQWDGICIFSDDIFSLPATVKKKKQNFSSPTPNSNVKFDQYIIDEKYNIRKRCLQALFLILHPLEFGRELYSNDRDFNDGVPFPLTARCKEGDHSGVCLNTNESFNRFMIQWGKYRLPETYSNIVESKVNARETFLKQSLQNASISGASVGLGASVLGRKSCEQLYVALRVTPEVERTFQEIIDGNSMKSFRGNVLASKWIAQKLKRSHGKYKNSDVELALAFEVSARPSSRNLYHNAFTGKVILTSEEEGEENDAALTFHKLEQILRSDRIKMERMYYGKKLDERKNRIIFLSATADAFGLQRGVRCQTIDNGQLICRLSSEWFHKLSVDFALSKMKNGGNEEEMIKLLRKVKLNTFQWWEELEHLWDILYEVIQCRRVQQLLPSLPKVLQYFSHDQNLSRIMKPNFSIDRPFYPTKRDFFQSAELLRLCFKWRHTYSSPDFANPELYNILPSGFFPPQPSNDYKVFDSAMGRFHQIFHRRKITLRCTHEALLPGGTRSQCGRFATFTCTSASCTTTSFKFLCNFHGSKQSGLNIALEKNLLDKSDQMIIEKKSKTEVPEHITSTKGCDVSAFGSVISDAIFQRGCPLCNNLLIQGALSGGDDVITRGDNSESQCGNESSQGTCDVWNEPVTLQGNDMDKARRVVKMASGPSNCVIAAMDPNAKVHILSWGRGQLNGPQGRDSAKCPKALLTFPTDSNDGGFADLEAIQLPSVQSWIKNEALRFSISDENSNQPLRLEYSDEEMKHILLAHHDREIRTGRRWCSSQRADFDRKFKLSNMLNAVLEQKFKMQRGLYSDLEMLNTPFPTSIPGRFENLKSTKLPKKNENSSSSTSQLPPPMYELRFDYNTNLWNKSAEMILHGLGIRFTESKMISTDEPGSFVTGGQRVLHVDSLISSNYRQSISSFNENGLPMYPEDENGSSNGNNNVFGSGAPSQLKTDFFLPFTQELDACLIGSSLLGISEDFREYPRVMHIKSKKEKVDSKSSNSSSSSGGVTTRRFFVKPQHVSYVQARLAPNASWCSDVGDYGFVRRKYVEAIVREISSSIWKSDGTFRAKTHDGESHNLESGSSDSEEESAAFLLGGIGIGKGLLFGGKKEGEKEMTGKFSEESDDCLRPWGHDAGTNHRENFWSEQDWINESPTWAVLVEWHDQSYKYYEFLKEKEEKLKAGKKLHSEKKSDYSKETKSENQNVKEEMLKNNALLKSLAINVHEEDLNGSTDSPLLNMRRIRSTISAIREDAINMLRRRHYWVRPHVASRQAELNELIALGFNKEGTNITASREIKRCGLCNVRGPKSSAGIASTGLYRNRGKVLLFQSDMFQTLRSVNGRESCCIACFEKLSGSDPSCGSPGIRRGLYDVEDCVTCDILLKHLPKIENVHGSYLPGVWSAANHIEEKKTSENSKKKDLNNDFSSKGREKKIVKVDNETKVVKPKKKKRFLNNFGFKFSSHKKEEKKTNVKLNLKNKLLQTRRSIEKQGRGTLPFDSSVEIELENGRSGHETSSSSHHKQVSTDDNKNLTPLQSYLRHCIRSDLARLGFHGWCKKLGISGPTTKILKQVDFEYRFIWVYLFNEHKVESNFPKQNKTTKFQTKSKSMRPESVHHVSVETIVEMIKAKVGSDLRPKSIDNSLKVSDTTKAVIHFVHCLRQGMGIESAEIDATIGGYRSVKHDFLMSPSMQVLSQMLNSGKKSGGAGGNNRSSVNNIDREAPPPCDDLFDIDLFLSWILEFIPKSDFLRNRNGISLTLQLVRRRTVFDTEVNGVEGTNDSPSASNWEMHSEHHKHHHREKKKSNLKRRKGLFSASNALGEDMWEVVEPPVVKTFQELLDEATCQDSPGLGRETKETFSRIPVNVKTLAQRAMEEIESEDVRGLELRVLNVVDRCDESLKQIFSNCMFFCFPKPAMSRGQNHSSTGSILPNREPNLKVMTKKSFKKESKEEGYESSIILSDSDQDDSDLFEESEVSFLGQTSEYSTFVSDSYDEEEETKKDEEDDDSVAEINNFLSTLFHRCLEGGNENELNRRQVTLFGELLAYQQVCYFQENGAGDIEFSSLFSEEDKEKEKVSLERLTKWTRKEMSDSKLIHCYHNFKRRENHRQTACTALFTQLDCITDGMNETIYNKMYKENVKKSSIEIEIPTHDKRNFWMPGEKEPFASIIKLVQNSSKYLTLSSFLSWHRIMQPNPRKIFKKMKKNKNESFLSSASEENDGDNDISHKGSFYKDIRKSKKNNLKTLTGIKGIKATKLRRGSVHHLKESLSSQRTTSISSNEEMSFEIMENAEYDKTAILNRSWSLEKEFPILDGNGFEIRRYILLEIEEDVNLLGRQGISIHGWIEELLYMWTCKERIFDTGGMQELPFETTCRGSNINKEVWKPEKNDVIGWPLSLHLLGTKQSIDKNVNEICHRCDDRLSVYKKEDSIVEDVYPDHVNDLRAIVNTLNEKIEKQKNKSNQMQKLSEKEIEEENVKRQLQCEKNVQIENETNLFSAENDKEFLCKLYSVWNDEQSRTSMKNYCRENFGNSGHSLSAFGNIVSSCDILHAELQNISSSLDCGHLDQLDRSHEFCEKMDLYQLKQATMLPAEIVQNFGRLDKGLQIPTRSVNEFLSERHIKLGGVKLRGYLMLEDMKTKLRSEESVGVKASQRRELFKASRHYLSLICDTAHLERKMNRFINYEIERKQPQPRRVHIEGENNNMTIINEMMMEEEEMIV
eukprot:g2496.t1